MKKSSYILGLIAGIAGIISCGVLLFIALKSPVTQKGISGVIGVSIITLLFQIAGLILAISAEKRIKLAGNVMILAGIMDIFAAFASITGDSPITFISCLVVAILFIVAGVLTKTKQKI